MGTPLTEDDKLLEDPLTTLGGELDFLTSAGLGSVATARTTPLRLRTLTAAGNERWPDVARV